VQFGFRYSGGGSSGRTCMTFRCQRPVLQTVQSATVLREGEGVAFRRTTNTQIPGMLQRTGKTTQPWEGILIGRADSGFFVLVAPFRYRRHHPTADKSNSLEPLILAPANTIKLALPTRERSHLFALPACLAAASSSKGLGRCVPPVPVLSGVVLLRSKLV